MVISETTSVALVHACSSLGGAVSGMELTGTCNSFSHLLPCCDTAQCKRLSVFVSQETMSPATGDTK